MHKSECILLKTVKDAPPSTVLRLQIRALIAIRQNLISKEEIFSHCSDMEKVPDEVKHGFGQWGTLISNCIPFAVPSSFTLDDHIRLGCVVR